MVDKDEDLKCSVDELAEDAVSRVLKALGKGEDLHSSCYQIVMMSINWANDKRKAKPTT